jgi:ABC-2 type transport system permease protein
LVVLSFSCSWVLPVLTSLVAGDVFAVEDRLGTWRHLLVAVRSPRRIFATKALASLTVIMLLVAGLAASGVVGGLAAVGNRPLVGLDGHLLAPSQAAGTVLLAWASVLAPTLAFAAVGLLGSVAFGRSPMGLVVPALLALMLQIAQLLPLPVVVRVALPSYPFIAWHGLFTDPAQTGPVVVGSSSGSPGRWPPPRSPTSSSCAATSPTSRTTGPAGASSSARCRWRRCSQPPSG